MRYWIALSLCLPLFGLELSLQSGKEEGEKFSILHLRHTTPFVCQATNNEFGETRRVDCRFSTAPKQSLSPIDNGLLSVSASSTPKGYTITILPKSKMMLVPEMFDLSKESQTYQSDVKKARHWNVVGYTKTLPLMNLSTPSALSINFPVKVQKNVPPYVGGLDLKGNPIKIRRVQDVTDYMEMKKAYAANDYHKVIDRAKNTLQEYPNTVFKNELILYQIRSYHQLGEYEKLLELSKKFLREYSADTSVAEVLAYTANAYSKIGQILDADYFFDRLFDEQIDSPFAAQGMIFKAEQSESSGDLKKAMMFHGLSKGWRFMPRGSLTRKENNVQKKLKLKV
ncbi:MAG: hypothetical protein Q8M43_08520 [Sulfuricurvum sp.]|uniref:tetratricopeptide repeat protein n=1 Tax=Sulfuricurvum sp. TaxID=2025608 RepID=UPI00273285D3|nr:hypothetical protein [Sulfuricurvum sp.]MDP3292061.1 hypothetical protein [Sulfuricurvum sp.]